MDSFPLICHQCGGPLPRQARWRTVSCTYCAAQVTRPANVVEAKRFHEAYLRACAADGPTLGCAGQRYRTLAQLGMGATARLMLAERIGVCPERVVLKVAHDASCAGRMKRESQILTDLQDDSASGAAYFTQRLPQALAFGNLEQPDGGGSEALVLRNPTGFWGSLAHVRANHPRGIDARHSVWMWRRTLDVLAYVHSAGWAHGDISPGHLLVHPRDHGILIIGWAGAQRVSAGDAACVRDLRQSAWVMRALLCAGDGDAVPAIPGSVPAPLAALLRRSSEDISWCASIGAQGLGDELVTAASTAFGAPKFIDFSPNPQP
jgi:serine/threonine protein kinase